MLVKRVRERNFGIVCRNGGIPRGYLSKGWSVLEIADLLDGWGKQRCVEARDGGHIKVNEEMLVYESASEKADIKYAPCSSRP